MSVQDELALRLQTLQPTFLQIDNDSAQHGGYVPGKESHFRVTVVSDAFAGLRLAQRHQRVYAAVGDLLAPGRIHALAIHACVPSEWQGEIPASPPCAHGPKPA